MPNVFKDVHSLWKRVSRAPAGKLLFSRGIGFFVPYSGTIGARVLELEPGYARVRMGDRRGVRNHLDSIHAAALVNLGELTGSLCVLASLPKNARMIVKGLSADYSKKARGTVIAHARCEVPADNRKQETSIEVSIEDATGDVVTKVVVRCLLGPKRPSSD